MCHFHFECRPCAYSVSKFLPGFTDVDGVATRAGDQVDEGKFLPLDFGHKEDSYIPVDAGILIVIIMMGVLRAHYICSTLTMLFSLLPGHLEKARSILARLDELVPNLVLVRMARISLERRHGEPREGVRAVCADTREVCQNGRFQLLLVALCTLSCFGKFLMEVFLFFSLSLAFCIVVVSCSFLCVCGCVCALQQEDFFTLFHFPAFSCKSFCRCATTCLKHVQWWLMPLAVIRLVLCVWPVVWCVCMC